MFYPKYHKLNLQRLGTLAPKTKAAAMKWYNYCIQHKLDVLVTETSRTVETQRGYVKAGKSTTMRSYHLVNQAFDHVFLVNGKADYNLYRKAPYNKSIAYAKTLGFSWGGDWRTFKDLPHLQYDCIAYGSDKSGAGNNPQPKKSIAATPSKSPKPIGVVTVKANLLNVRKAPTTTAGVVKAIKKGEAYKCYEIKNGWYNVGIGWVHGSYVNYKKA